jgi:hypothetical protein
MESVAQPGDGIKIPHASPVTLTSDIYNLPVPATSIPISSISGNYFVGSNSLANGQYVRVGSVGGLPPTPIQEGITYAVKGASGSQFELSQDGTNVTTLADSGSGALYVIPWPISGVGAKYVLIHTDDDNNLPPFGVNIDPVAYASYMGQIILPSPSVTSGNSQYSFIGFAFNAYYWFEGIRWTMNPVATAAQIDPPGYEQFFYSYPETDHIIFDRNWFNFPPPPDRIAVEATVAGSNMAILSSYWDNENWWKVTKYPDSGAANPVINNSAGTVTFSVSTYSWPTVGNVYDSCSTGTQVLTVSGGSNASPLSFYVYFQHDPCVLTVLPQTGLTVTSTGSVTVLPAVATLSWPVDGGGYYTAVRVMQGTQTTGNINATFYNTAGTSGSSGGPDADEGNNGMHLLSTCGTASGPTLIQGGQIFGTGIIGPFKDENTGNGCTQNPSGVQNLGVSNDLTVQRVRVASPLYTIPASSSWTGGWYGNRNGPENKLGLRNKYVGNILGPWTPGVAQGECGLFATYSGSVSASNLALQNIQDTSDGEWAYNTCMAPLGLSSGWGVYAATWPGKLLQRIWIHDNLLFINWRLYTSGSLPQNDNVGTGVQFYIGAISDLDIEHNDSILTTGIFSPAVNLCCQPLGDWTISNNIFTFVIDNPGAGGLIQNNSGVPNPAYPDYTNYTVDAMLPNLNNVALNNNVWLSTCSNSTLAPPYCAAEMTNSQIASYATGYSSYPTNVFPSTGTTLANRLAGLSWYSYPTAWINPLTSGVPNIQNYTFNYLSPFISGGANRGSDGLDVGTNINAVLAAQGQVLNVHVSARGTTTASITVQAPPSGGAWDGTGGTLTLDYGTANFPSGSGTWTRINSPSSTTQAANGFTIQTFNLTGLTTGTTYTVRVNGAVMQPVITFTTN